MLGDIVIMISNELKRTETNSNELKRTQTNSNELKRTQTNSNEFGECISLKSSPLPDSPGTPANSPAPKLPRTPAKNATPTEILSLQFLSEAPILLKQ